MERDASAITVRIGRPLKVVTVTQPFSALYDGRYAPYPGHPAVDLRAAVGTPVYACHDGWVECAVGPVCGKQIWLYGQGQDADLLTRYNHLSEFRVATGVSVKRGQVIALSGATGRCDGAHLDLMLRIKGVENPAYGDYLDPMEYMEEEVPMPKTCPHVQRVEPWMAGAFARWGCQWVKIVNPPEADPFPAIPHKIVRWHTDAQDGAYIGCGFSGGVDFVRDMWAGPWGKRRWARCYSLANEPGWCNDLQRLPTLAQYWIGAMAEANTLGISLVIGECSEASPHGGEPYGADYQRAKLAAMAPAVQYATHHAHYLGQHLYWRPGVCGPEDRWHAMGHLDHMVAVWREMGIILSGLKVIVSEWGCDGSIAGHPRAGWRSLYADRNEYFDDLRQGEWLLQERPWIVCANLFNFGAEQDWLDYDHREGDMGAVIVATRGGATMPEPNVPPVVQLPSVEQVREAAWNRLYPGPIPYNPKAAFPAYARSKSFGVPTTVEFDLNGARCQGYAGGIVMAPIGAWDKVTHVSW